MSTVAELLGTAADTDATISPRAVKAVLGKDETLALIERSMGISADEITANQVTILVPVIDDSGSMEGKQGALFAGYETLLEAFKGASGEGRDVIVCTIFLNRDDPLHPFILLPGAPKLDSDNYWTHGVTPLYDKNMAALALATAKATELRDAGVGVCVEIILVSDGIEYRSRLHTLAEVHDANTSAIKSEDVNVQAMGIGGTDDEQVEFHRQFEKMGIRNILTSGSTESEIRKAFDKASKSAVAHSQATLGGLGD